MENIYFFIIIIFLAGFTQGFSGFGSMLISLPLLTLFLEVKTVIPVVSLFGLCINIILFIQIREHIQWGRVKVLLLSSIPGLLCGVYILRSVRSDALELVIGVLIILFPIYLLITGTKERTISNGWGWFFGFCSGILGGSIGANGPPVIIYTSLQPWGKYRMKSTLVAFFLVSGVGISSLHAANHFITTRVLNLFLTGLPSLVVGVLAGSYLFGKFEARIYRNILSVLLIFLGCFMVLKIIL